ncbi:hypothetical protein EY643_13565 [Halioglobus maricola]|uniref:Esterase-like activity of phytase family protein n=1 Tax=Halioglobus maricola TaxID=2601894 RepID=A0A5P9NLH5_9GAMM|nr:hypothetical protein [Halioglobus maricola]QFU76602.1 hypothetical protein EY643_13565 [Halioglobus maricola]
MPINRILTFLLLTLNVYTANAEPLIKEVSGIVRLGDKLLIVADGDLENYYEYDISNLDSRHIVLSEVNRIQKKQIIKTKLHVDFESIDMLADGEVIVLSERLRSLVSAGGTIISYPSRFGEYAQVGLEGLTSRPTSGVPGSYDIAVLWEGGYPESRYLPSEAALPTQAFRPVVITHTVNDGKVSRPFTEIVLNTDSLSKWVDEKEPKGKEPHAFRFRAPDLVWHRNGFIVLLSGVRMPSDDDSSLYGPVVLQRFDLTGEPIGDPFELTPELKALKVPGDKNWEGLAWYDQGKTLMLVNDDGREDAHVPLIRIPLDW